MDYHHHARLTIYSREQLANGVVEGRLSLREAAAERGLSRQSAAKWVRRYRLLGAGGLVDFSSRPHRCPRSTPVQLAERVERLRRHLSLLAHLPACVHRRQVTESLVKNYSYVGLHGVPSSILLCA
jgi:hypothetical protein